MAGGSDLLDRRERVVLAEDLAGVAEGTSGEVMLHTGMRWLRYWVRFDSGAERGSIHRDKLVREAEWEDFLIKRAEAEAAAEAAAAAGELVGESSSNGADEESEAGGDDAGGDVVVNGATLPAHLLARSASARERLGG
ncbi:hypothetical protein [Candidatus Poriferisocius sp.]|uniref:hypothetical protein n=1 Tax=Candidatus Poriferisocius sp. TaxID=3101276 RepID=UPI003B027B81